MKMYFKEILDISKKIEGAGFIMPADRFISVLNQLSAKIFKATKFSGANIIEIHPNISKLVTTTIYFDRLEMKLSSYDIVFNDKMPENEIFVYIKKPTDGEALDRWERTKDVDKYSRGTIELINPNNEDLEDKLILNMLTPAKKNKTALIAGITGQDGSYLAELLLEKGYQVHGIIRRSSSFNTERIDHIFDKITLHYGDVTDAMGITNLIAQIKPDEIYNLAAQSHVKVSFEQPYYTANVDALGTLTILEAMRIHCPNSRFYQASTSELYGGMGYNMPETGYTEESPFHPRSPYGVAKIYGYWIVKNYREAYGLYACNGILFNHESPRRGGTFVTKKVINNLAEVHMGKRDHLIIGNMDAKRDWGYAKEYVEGMWLMLQQNMPQDYVLATNETHTVRELIEITCKELGFDLEWRGSGVEEKGYDKNTGKLLVEVDEKYFRPSEVSVLLGDSSKAKRNLGWEPKVKFKELVSIMLEAENKIPA